MRKAGSLLVALICLAANNVHAGGLQRCQSLSQGVRKAHAYYFGVDFPYEYSVGQLQQESNCRDVISRDGVGSEGPAQITYRLWQGALKQEGIAEIRSTANHLKAQAFINRSAWRQAEHKRLWVMYQIYNGGGLVNTEIRRAGKADWRAAYSVCRRKIVRFKDGSTESACDINYDYSRRVYRYGEQYRTVAPGTKYQFW